MQKTLLTLLGILVAAVSMAQVSGTITDQSGEPLIGVNVYIKDTYDGATTDIEGKFSFTTIETGEQILIASYIGYKAIEMPVNLNEPLTLSIALKEDVNRLSGVTITAGSFEASDEKKAVVLKPLDIAMTAGGTADITGALNTLPGTTTNGESGRLFVRGGTSTETQAYIDGALVHSFYTPSPNNVPSRSRFSPFLFKGTFFSTGGYSAEYGQALSSVISLTSNDLPDETRTDISLMSVGADVAHTQKWERGSIYGQVQHTNLNPYNSLVKQEYDWEKGFSSTAGTFMLRQKLADNNMLKVYANMDESSMALNYPSINSPTPDHVDLTNRNFYLNSSYRHAVGTSGMVYLGGSYGTTKEDILFNDMDVNDEQEAYHAKAYYSTDIDNVTIKAGGEIMSSDHTEFVILEDNSERLSSYNSIISAGFVESDYYVSNDLTLRTGLRFSNYSLYNQNLLSPRISMAYKTSAHGQVSAAYGEFHQLPTGDLLIRSTQPTYETADHYMVSYQQIHDGITFRAEVYRKQYDRLVKFDDQFDPFSYSNRGNGYAQGLDLFFRDSKTFKNIDYWVTYSYLDTKRDHLNFPTAAMPGFAAKHNFSVVYKHFFDKLKTSFGASFRYNSGRPYNDPNESTFNGGRTKDFADLSMNFAYLHRQNVILYVSATNLLGRDNVFGYEFEEDPGADNYFDSRAITQPAKRFLFVGIFITLTKDKSKNNLDNL